MFEDRQKSEIDALLASDTEFRDLYRHHKDLDKKVHDAEIGVLPVDDIRLGQMKREKLAAKEELLRMYDQLN